MPLLVNELLDRYCFLTTEDCWWWRLEWLERRSRAPDTCKLIIGLRLALRVIAVVRTEMNSAGAGATGAQAKPGMLELDAWLHAVRLMIAPVQKRKAERASVSDKVMLPAPPVYKLHCSVTAGELRTVHRLVVV